MEPMEIHIAIVEDEEDHAHYIKSIADKWAAQNRIKIHADMFESAENFKSAQGEGKEFDMVLLDVQMGGQNGIELAKELRKTDDNKPIIIFITAMADLMSEGFEVSALHYLVKPIDADKFCEVLDRAQKSLTQSGGSALFLQTDEGNVRIASDEIVYVESFDHFLEINALSKKHTVKMPLYELESTLGGSFVRSHRCYIVNLKYVKKITKTEITLDSNEVVPLSRRLYTEANRAMAKYIKEGKNR